MNDRSSVTGRRSLLLSAAVGAVCSTLPPWTAAFANIPSDDSADIHTVPEALTRGKESIEIRFEPEPGNTAGPVFGCRTFTKAPATKVSN